MGTVRRLAEKVERGLPEARPGLRKTMVGKWALAVAAMIKGQTPHTAERANLWPLAPERPEMREHWLRRLLKNPLLSSAGGVDPWARQALEEASPHGPTVILRLDQTDLGDRCAVWMLGGVMRGRALPLAWAVEAGPANLGFTSQETVLDRVRGGLPTGAEVLL